MSPNTLASHDIVAAARVGQVSEFTSHGKRWDVVKISRSEYSFGCEGVTRRRYGDRWQIANDVLYAMSFGVLPERIDHAF